jgi:hypothetical protein
MLAYKRTENAMEVCEGRTQGTREMMRTRTKKMKIEKGKKCVRDKNF